MNITIMFNHVTLRYTMVLSAESNQAALDTLYLTQVANMINILRPVYPVSLVFNNSFDNTKREELKQLMRDLMAV